ncbi:hypothetical protein ACFKIX_000447 [Vibrio alginolyticus]
MSNEEISHRDGTALRRRRTEASSSLSPALPVTHTSTGTEPSQMKALLLQEATL